MTHPIIAFDIETIGLGGEACFVSWCEDGEAHGKKLTGDEDFTAWFISTMLSVKNNGAMIFAHYGMRFDLLRLNWLSIAAAGYTGRFYHGKDINNIRGIDISKGRRKYKIRDSFCYFPGSLDSFVKTFAANKYQKGKIDFSKTVFDASRKSHVNYAINDSLVLWHAIQGLADMLDKRFELNIYETVTISGASYLAMRRLAKSNDFEPMLKLDSEYEDIVRGSYHGGMTCAFKLGKFADVLYLDINSAYAHVMHKYPMPTGTPIMTTVEPKSRCIKLIEATVEIPDAFPFVITRQNGRSGRYGGHVSGWFWDFELARQRELGAIINCTRWLCWGETDTRQAAYIDRCRKLRFVDYDGALGQLAKLMQNSCYGKHGLAPIESDLILSEIQPARGLPIIARDGEIVDGLWSVANEKESRTMVHWASYITARVRYILMGLLMRVPQRDWIYCDTDSIMIPKKYRPLFKDVIGKKYGQLKIEGVMDSVEIRGPKFYKLRQGKKIIYRAKGIPRRQVSTAWEKGAVIYDAGHSLGVIMRSKKRVGNKYVTRATRRVSTAGNVYCGAYIGGVWTPDIICDKVK